MAEHNEYNGLADSWVAHLGTWATLDAEPEDAEGRVHCLTSALCSLKSVSHSLSPCKFDSPYKSLTIYSCLTDEKTEAHREVQVASIIMASAFKSFVSAPLNSHFRASPGQKYDPKIHPGFLGLWPKKQLKTRSCWRSHCLSAKENWNR